MPNGMTGAAFTVVAPTPSPGAHHSHPEIQSTSGSSCPLSTASGWQTNVAFPDVILMTASDGAVRKPCEASQSGRSIALKEYLKTQS